MRSSIGFHLSEVIRCTQGMWFFASCKSNSERKLTATPTSDRMYDRLIAQREGESYGHAFRAAEMIYEKAIEDWNDLEKVGFKDPSKEVSLADLQSPEGMADFLDENPPPKDYVIGVGYVKD